MSGKCRFCNKSLKNTFIDLGVSPLSNNFLTQSQLDCGEYFYPLRVFICGSCQLVQLNQYESPDNIFDDEYAYYSSYSQSWLNHAQHYCDMMIKRFGFNEHSSIVEVASNDGYLLQYFHQYNIPVLGIEPAANVAKVARNKGVETVGDFLSHDMAKRLTGQRGTFDLVLGNNVLAHVPELNDFILGLKTLLAPDGVMTLEFPHLLKLVTLNQFDTIYHEHFSYFSLNTVKHIFDYHNLRLFDVDRIATHGGSLRLYLCHQKSEKNRTVNLQNINTILSEEKLAGLMGLENYSEFSKTIESTKFNILNFLIDCKDKRKSVVGYGAPAKANTLFNYCGINTQLIQYTVDKNPQKQNCYLPGSRIPVYSPDKIAVTKPDYVIILPWNIRDEIVEQMAHISQWGGQFVTFIPKLRIGA